ncbi:MAG: hypothetical protein JWN34_6353 [Bryobacterales bacterium]|nr:hypothetical protein [Bryobacterales bacterium]
MVKSLALALLLATVTWAQTPPTTDLERRILELEDKMRLIDPAFGRDMAAQNLAQRIDALEKKMSAVLAPSPVPAPAAAATPMLAAASPLTPVSVSGDFQNAQNSETRLPVAGYMDFHVNRDANAAWKPDFHRFVLLFGHSFSDRIKFWSELELEHSLLEGGEETGEIALEQAYLDFLITPRFNIRAGMLLSPVGIVNERHEPPSFNGVERPAVETLIIPTTWRELGFGVTGDLGRGFRYRAYLMSSLDAKRFDAESGITEGRTAGFDASFRNPAKVGRLEYAGVRRLTLGTSFYSGHAGFNLPGLNPRVNLAEFDGRYSFRRFDLRGIFANTWVSRAGELNARLENQIGHNPNVASQMRGYYVEPGWHVLPRRLRHDIVAFTRYERFNTQQQMPVGYTALPQFDRSAWVTGLTYRPTPDVAVKFDYIVNRNASAVVRAVNGMNLGIGWWF